MHNKAVTSNQLLLENYTHLCGDDKEYIEHEIDSMLRCGYELYFPSASNALSIVAPEVRSCYVYTMTVAKKLGLERNIKIIGFTRERMIGTRNKIYVSFDILQYREMGFDNSTVSKLVLLPLSLDSMRKVVDIIGKMNYSSDLYMNIHEFAKRMLIFVNPYADLPECRNLSHLPTYINDIYRLMLMEMIEASKLASNYAIIQFYDFYLSLKLINKNILTSHPIWIQISKESSDKFIIELLQQIQGNIETIHFPIEEDIYKLISGCQKIELPLPEKMNGLENINDPKAERVTKSLISSIFTRILSPRRIVHEQDIRFQLQEQTIMEYMYYYQKEAPIILQPLITYNNNEKQVDWRYMIVWNDKKMILFEFTFMHCLYGMEVSDERVETIIQIQLKNDAEYSIQF